MSDQLNSHISSFYPPQRTLMGPGPSEIHPRVFSAMGRPTIGYLDPVFVDMMEELKELLRYAFQTKNAMALVSADSAILMRDVDAREDLVPALYALVENEDKKMELSSNIKALAKPNATEDIVDACETLLS